MLSITAVYVLDPLQLADNKGTPPARIDWFSLTFDAVATADTAKGEP